MQIAPGARVGPYEIVASIGSGGMGEVWRARDPRIGRDVAIKFVPAALRSPDRLHRFEQEARAAGSLSHPNLVTVFDLGTDNAAPYVVMELLDGETLREKLTGDARVPVRKAIEYAVQIASGLAAAHEHGIVHRDLKPENIIVTDDGRVKIVDFGLAKLSSRAEGQTDAATAQRDTAPGTVMGTAGYMSPEQVRGSAVDHRSDIFAFGAILYEMLSGRRAFKGDSSVETMNAILKEDPPEFPTSDIPPALDTIVRHCLEKNPAERFQSARDLAFDLRRMTAPSTSSAHSVTAKRAVPSWLLPALAFALIAGAAGFFAGRRGASSAAVNTATTPRTFTQLTFQSHEYTPTLSPDGKTFAYVSDATGNLDIYVQRVDGRNAINLTKDSPARDLDPAFSPDGSQIAFRSGRGVGGIFVMGATGESVRRVSDFGFNPAWSPDGKHLLVTMAGAGITPYSRAYRGTLWLLDVRTGEKREITKAPRDAAQPAWSPNGKRAAFWGLSGDSGQRDIFTIDPGAADPEKTITRVTADAAVDWSPQWSPDGKWLYFGSDRNGTLNLWRVAIDEESGKTTGSAEVVMVPARFAGNFSLARDGTVAFAVAEDNDTIWTVKFKAGTPAGPPQAALRGSLTIYSVDVSKDAQWIAFSNLGLNEDIYVMRAGGTDIRQLTSDPDRDRAPVFSADGSKLYFYSERSGRYEVWSVRTDGSEMRQVSRTTGRSMWFPHPTADEKAIYVFNRDSGSVRLPVNDDGTTNRMEPMPVVPGGAPFVWPQPSPDGSRVAGHAERGPARGLWMYSVASKSYERITERGIEPTWLADGRTLLFHDDGRIAAVDTVTKKTRTLPLLSSLTAGRIAISKDGSLLVVAERKTHSAIWLMK